MFRLGLFVALFSISGSSICGRNEVQVTCGHSCPKSCHPQSCVRVLCYGSCNCLGGYIRVNKYQGPCVLPSECARYPTRELHTQKTHRVRSKPIQFRNLVTMVTQRRRRPPKKQLNKTKKINPRSPKAKELYTDLWTAPRDAVAYDYFDHKPPFDYGELTTGKRAAPTTTSKPPATETESSPFIQEHIQR